MAMPTKKRLFILDANALLHRAWHALPPLTNPDGQVVQAVYGVISVVLKLLQEQKPDSFIACWDTEAATFRHVAYKEYKAHRKEQPDELYAQVPWLKEGLALLGVESFELDGFEADDLIGTIAYQAKKDGWEVVIVTGDRDALQLIQPSISVMAFKKGVSETVMYDEEEVKRQYGLTVAQFLEYKAMRGDPSDNIPGIRGIGEKGATDLLQRFGSLKQILKAAHDESSTLSPSTRQKLLAAEKDIPAILQLVTIATDVPVQWTPKSQTFPADRQAFIAFLLRMGFKTLTKRVPGADNEVPIDDEEKTVKKNIQKKKQNATGFEDVRLDRPESALKALEELRGAATIAVRVARGAQDSLFANAIEGVVLATEKKALLFTLDVLKKNAEVKKALQELLSDTKVSKVAHDAKTEMTSLDALGLSVRGWVFDTMIAAYLLGAGERNHEIVSIAARYADLMLSEDASVFRQTEAILRLVPVLQKKMQEENLLPIFERFEMPLIPVLREMERHGILVDRDYLKELSKRMTADKEALEKKMMKVVGKTFNPASPTQLAQILFEDLKLPTKGVKRGKTGYSTAALELEKLKGAHPLIAMIEDHRELSKLLSTYVDVLPTLTDAKGRIHTTYNQAVAATGRLSSTEPNLQNIPVRTEVGRLIRHAFIAEQGYRLLSCDYSQIELRLVAALAHDEKMLAAFHRGEDIHAATAAAIWNMPQAEVTKDQRRIAKAINFGLIFGQGPQGLSVTAGISFADAKKFIAAYFEVYRGIKEYMEQTKSRAHQLGYVETFFGRRRYLPEIQSTMHQLRAQAERMAINMPVQGTDADLMKLAMIEVSKTLPAFSPRSRLLLQVHDELLLEVPEEEVEKVAAFIKDIMEQIEKVGVPIVVEAKEGGNWDTMQRVGSEK